MKAKVKKARKMTVASWLAGLTPFGTDSKHVFEGFMLEVIAKLCVARDCLPRDPKGAREWFDEAERHMIGMRDLIEASHLWEDQ